jgi:hypothetical protein
MTILQYPQDQERVFDHSVDQYRVTGNRKSYVNPSSRQHTLSFPSGEVQILHRDKVSYNHQTPARDLLICA